MKKITTQELEELALEFKIPVSKIFAIKKVESGGKGFDEKTGKLIIQFEPAWFKKQAPYMPSGRWSLNGVERQEQEWIAFNDAFKLHANGAMESTSIGLMQVLGLHFKRLGFKSVGAMWDFAKKSEKNQLWLGLEFIRTDKIMYQALVQGRWAIVARRYNGSLYYVLKYDVKLANAEKEYLDSQKKQNNNKIKTA